MDLSSVKKAQLTLAPLIHKTPLLTSQAVAGLYFKAENLQIGGSFKIRAAYNIIASLSDEERRRGVVTSSSGNYAQAVAYAAKKLGISAKIVMMRRSNPLKVARTRALGADVVCCGNSYPERTEKVREIETTEGRVMIHPFDHPAVVAGNGTLALEILDQHPSLKNVVVPISGGGLIAGVSFAVKAVRKDVRVWGVQPVGSNAAYLSFHAGRRVPVGEVNTIADGLTVNCPGEFTFPLLKQHVDNVVMVTEDSLREAVRHYFLQEKLVVEPAGAAALAAVLEQQVPAEETVCVISGGNIDPRVFLEILSPD